MDRAGRLHLIGSVPLAVSEIPVPKGRTDDAYWAALEGRKRPPGTRLHLGLLRGDLGVSYAYGSPISPLIGASLTVSLPLAAMAMALSAGA